MMKASTRIEIARSRLKEVAALSVDQPERLVRELQRSLAVEAKNILDNYGTGPYSLVPIQWLLNIPLAEVPVSDFAIQEFQRCVSNWPRIINPHEFLEQVSYAVEGIVYYQLGWSSVVEDRPIQALWTEQTGEIVISDTDACYHLSGDIYLGNGPLRPATKSELLACGLYNYHTAGLLD